MKLFLCGFGVAGESVLRRVVKRPDINEVAVFTHEAGVLGQSLMGAAGELGVWCTTGSVNQMGLWPFEPDVISSVYYRTIVKPHVIDAVGGRIFNAHSSLLPRHRGRSPVAWAIVEGDFTTGVTFHYIDEGIDTGKVILQVPIRVAPDETQASLFSKVDDATVEYWSTALTMVKWGLTGWEQTAGLTSNMSYHSAGPPYGGRIDPNWPEDQVERFIRAMTYPPLPYATVYGEEVRNLDEYRTVLQRHHRDAVSEQRAAHRSIHTAS